MVAGAVDILRTLGILQAIQAAAVITIAYLLYHKFFS